MPPSPGNAHTLATDIGEIRPGADLHALPRLSAFGTWEFCLGQVSGFPQLSRTFPEAR